MIWIVQFDPGPCTEISARFSAGTKIALAESERLAKGRQWADSETAISMENLPKGSPAGSSSIGF